MVTCQACAARLDPAWKYCIACGTPTGGPSIERRTPVTRGPRVETSSRARQRTRTDTAVRDAATLKQWRRTMIAGIAVLLFIALATGIILFVMENA